MFVYALSTLAGRVVELLAGDIEWQGLRLKLLKHQLNLAKVERPIATAMLAESVDINSLSVSIPAAYRRSSGV